MLSGIVFVNRNGLRWRDAPSAYGPHKTLYNRWKRWGDRLDLVLAIGYVGRLLANARVVRYLAQFHPEILAEFQKIVEAPKVA